MVDKSHHDQITSKPHVPVWQLSVASAVALFLLLNGLLLWKQPLAKVDPDALPAAHTWTWWATQEYYQQKKAPDVVLLGSSLIMHPISRADADLHGKDLDYVKHHRSNLMEHSLESALNLPEPVCFNFGLPGSMVSDDYMVMRSFFEGARKPKVVVLGVSLRDFMDTSVHCIGTTPAFKYLKRFSNIDDLLDLAMPQIFERSDYLIGKGIYLWGKKLDLQVVLAAQAKNVLNPIYSRYFMPSRLAEADPEKNMPSNLRAEIEEGMFMVKHDEPYSFEDNSSGYRKRYRSPNTKMFEAQTIFLDKLCRLARDRGIELVLVNMPMTQQNHNLMPPGSYDKYIATLQATSAKYGAPFLDLDAQHNFDLADYYDTAHMNSSGGRKLVNAIVETFKNNQQVCAALRASNDPELADRNQKSL